MGKKPNYLNSTELNSTELNSTETSAKVSTSHNGHRLDITISRIYEISRKMAKDLCDCNYVKLNGKIAKKSIIVKDGDLIETLTRIIDSPFPARKSFQKCSALNSAKSVDIIYEDEACIALSKPRLMHSVSLRSRPDIVSLADYLVTRFPKILSDTRIANMEDATLAQRLDYYTSGLILAGLNLEIKEVLLRDLKEGKICKSYLALLQGSLSKEDVMINKDIFITPDFNKVHFRSVNKKSKCFEATTVFSPLLSLHSKNKTVATLALVTGQGMRRHQIRAHAQCIEHPLIGDDIYSDSTIKLSEFLPDKQESHLNQGFLLHASSIVFQQPSTRQNVKIVHFPDYISRCLTTQQGSILRQRLEIHS